jgi:DNA-binding PadR family transcriptional regulator
VPRKKKNADPSDFLPLSVPTFHVLVALAAEDLHGWGILKEVEEATGGAIRLSPGTLYGLIKRLLRDDLIRESDARPPRRWDDPRRRYYALTPLGRRVAAAEAERMRRALAVARNRLPSPGRA